jgi:hypothetical protein
MMEVSGERPSAQALTFVRKCFFLLLLLLLLLVGVLCRHIEKSVKAAPLGRILGVGA